ncbi:hypothetical protein [Candidatus Uabimicrobium amorphum]|uniref:Uncharacterized protein n=1 Tax=Uabimicrobium amorphum TaxID=2596890 RepID=A0A5S9IUA7_UABAM|nr:hypothetical protein [Candidatus Uabimicrobium amorphum]BBM88273.1 hypothetical protein UABAM_06694 [Candidatus Uabimicrobium amorphum]
MKIIKNKTLHAVELYTTYLGCTFYLERPYYFNDCVFDNCSFRGELHYVESEEVKSNFPIFDNCSFNCEEVSAQMIDGDIDYNGASISFLLEVTNTLIIKPYYTPSKRIKIETPLPKIKIIDISAYENYRENETHLHWFDQFPTLQKVILPPGLPYSVVIEIYSARKKFDFFSKKQLRQKDNGITEEVEVGRVLKRSSHYYTH